MKPKSSNVVEIPTSTSGIVFSKSISLIPCSKLKPNPLNAKFFDTEGSDYFEELTADIKKRGITIPLIAKRDYTLLSGHNRLIIAKSLRILKVPVVFVENELSEIDEAKFVIFDNTKRRHLGEAKRREIYRRFYPSFDDIVLISRKGKRYPSEVLDMRPETISKATGIPIHIVRKDITCIRNQHRYMVAKERKTPSERSIHRVDRNIKRLLAELASCTDETFEVLNKKVQEFNKDFRRLCADRRGKK